ncbi:MAG: hypothetical protein JJ920_12895 [Roseitalea sp.]|jgi:hypothetical protein|nr:hypothetical protein [Roseitalea sp.]MBO6720656.1 hypothetical protein [Roseitalea sp.]MBO6743803.1 hypothetical protein [Roseitalea sp.]
MSAKTSRLFMGPTEADVERAVARALTLRQAIDDHVTPERITRYVRALAETSAPSSAAGCLRGPVLTDLWRDDGAFETEHFSLDTNHAGSGELAVVTGDRTTPAQLWLFAHLDTISYLVSHPVGEGYRLVPYCYHLTQDGRRDAHALRYDLTTGQFVTVADGVLVSEGGSTRFEPAGGPALQSGDRVVPVTAFACDENGFLTAHLDNAGGVAALAVAAPLFARLGREAFFAFPDEEEGPAGSGNHMIARGSARIATACQTTPDLAVVVDMQQFGDAHVLGSGAVLSEYASGGRGSVTPPPLYRATTEFFSRLGPEAVSVCENGATRISRSDDVSVMLRTSSILLLGFPGADRHFDTKLPTAHLADLVHLTKALVYLSALGEVLRERRDG